MQTITVNEKQFRVLECLKSLNDGETFFTHEVGDFAGYKVVPGKSPEQNPQCGAAWDAIAKFQNLGVLTIKKGRYYGHTLLNMNRDYTKENSNGKIRLQFGDKIKEIEPEEKLFGQAEEQKLGEQISISGQAISSISAFEQIAQLIDKQQTKLDGHTDEIVSMRTRSQTNEENIDTLLKQMLETRQVDSSVIDKLDLELNKLSEKMEHVSLKLADLDLEFVKRSSFIGQSLSMGIAIDSIKEKCSELDRKIAAWEAVVTENKNAIVEIRQLVEEHLPKPLDPRCAQTQQIINSTFNLIPKELKDEIKPYQIFKSDYARKFKRPFPRDYDGRDDFGQVPEEQLDEVLELARDVFRGIANSYPDNLENITSSRQKMALGNLLPNPTN